MNKLRGLTVTILITAMIAMTPWAGFCFAETADAAEPVVSGQEAAIATGSEQGTATSLTAEIPAVSCESETPSDNDELFEGYVDSLFKPAAPKKLLAKRRTPLTGVNLTIYEKLKTEIAEVANGTRPSTIFEVSVEDLKLEKNSWTAEDLGVDAIVVNGAISQEAVDAFWEKLDLNLDAILNTLLAECPFEMYWYDKLGGVEVSGGMIGAGRVNGQYVLRLVNGFDFSFAVAQDYAAGTYELDTTIMDRVNHAIDKAASIVDDNKGKTDREKLRAYKTAICGLVSYDDNAAGGDVPFGDPWQLISVFDEIKSTNVVCEGYSKAFQYLCDLTDFNSDISCISVTGTMAGGTGEGGHMWNVVRLENGKNYIADLTNCDSGSVGSPDQLFLAGYTSVSGNVYTFRCSGGNVRYTYDEETLDGYDESDLAIAERVVEPSGHTEEVMPGKAATCTETGLTEGKKCSVCGEILVAQEEIPALGHDYGDWAVTKAVTCTENGEEQRVCSHDNTHIEKRTIEASGHTEVAIPGKAATCTEAGLTDGKKCSVCGEVLVAQEELPALGHDYGAWTVTKAVTCTEDGEEQRVCSHDNTHIETRTIEAPGHTEVAIPGKAATCTEDGLTEGKKCSVCGEVLVAQEEITAFGHDFGEWVTVTESTEEAAGLEKRTCSRCGEEDSRVIPELGHVHDPRYVEAKGANCTEDGNIEFWKCSKCGRFFIDENAENEIAEEETVIKAAGHKEEAIAGKDATCTETGLTEGKKCSVCGEILKEQEEIPALGHDYGEWTVTTAATCTEDGEEQRVCSHDKKHIETRTVKAAGHTEEVIPGKAATCTETGLTEGTKCSVCEEILAAQEEIPALGHDYGAWTVTTAATCTEDGEEQRVCSHDNTHIEKRTIKAAGHVEEVMPAVDPTYTATGLTEGKKCSVCGEILEAQKEIPALERTPIEGATVSGLKAKVYSGKAQTQALTVVLGDTTLKPGTDYELSYAKNTNVGTASVTITGLNAYIGTITKTFKINPKATKMSSVSALSKGFTAKWKKLTTQTTGYQIQYSTSSTFKSGNKTVTITKNTTTSRKVTKLKAKKKYYVRVRTYRKVSGTTYYSAWSAKKAVTTKK